MSKEATERATGIVRATEWSGDMRINMTTIIGAGRVLAKRVGELESEVSRYRTALADACRRPMGVVPDSADGLLAQDDLEAAEARRVEVVRKRRAAGLLSWGLDLPLPKPWISDARITENKVAE